MAENEVDYETTPQGEEMNEMNKYVTVNLIGLALTQEWNGGLNDWALPRYMQWFYRVKAVICLLLNREPPKFEGNFDSIVVSVIDGGTTYIPSEPTIYWWVALRVGYGITRRWWFAIEDDST